jgi:hypothetical protein
MGLEIDVGPAAGAPPSRLGTSIALALAAAWLALFALMLRRTIYVSHDSMISYAHVWYIAGHLGPGVPLRMPVLDHGLAFAYPYGIVPWTTAALLRPLLGDHVVTLWFVLGAAGVLVATFWAFPELRRGWLAAAALLNPAVVAGLLIGQQPFLWASALLLGAVGAWRRGRPWLATALAALAQATHPAIVLPLALVLVLGALPWAKDRRALVVHHAISAALALPAVWIVVASPVVADTSITTKLAAFFETLGPRALVLAVPVALAVLPVRRLGRWVGPAALAGVLTINVALWAPLRLPWARAGLWRQPDAAMVAFIDSPTFARGATYRLLRVADGKVGMYQLIQHGARLDSEFFPESMNVRSWSGTRAYGAFLRHRHVEYVMLWRGFDGVYHTNEHAVLRRMASQEGCTAAPVAITTVQVTRSYDLFRVRQCG